MVLPGAAPPASDPRFARTTAEISPEPYNKNFTNAELLTGASERVIDEDEYRNYGPFNGIIIDNLDAGDDLKVKLNGSDDNFLYVPANSSRSVFGRSWIFSFITLDNVGAGTIAAEHVQISVYKYFGID